MYAGGVCISTLDTVNTECMLYWSLQYTGYSEYVECTLLVVVYSTLDIHCIHVRSVCLWSLQYIGYSEYGVYACGVYSTLDTVNMECMLVESAVHWIQ